VATVQPARALPPGLGGVLVLDRADYGKGGRHWLAARQSGLGASETAAVLGINEWKTPLAVWLDKTGDVPDGIAPSEAAEWGTELEAVVARKVATRHPELGKLAPSPGLLAHERYPWMLATLDRLLVERRVENPRVRAGLEVKTVSKYAYDERWIDGFPPLSVQVQVQQQLAVTNLSRIWVAVLVGGQKMPAPIPIDRDETLIERIVIEAGDWWHRYVVTGIEPPIYLSDDDPPTYRDAYLRDVQRLWPGNPDAEPLYADEEVRDLLATFRNARKVRKATDDLLAATQLAIEVAMKDATSVVDDETGALLATWKPQTSNRVDLTALRERYPVIAEELTRPSASRVFRPKEITA